MLSMLPNNVVIKRKCSWVGYVALVGHQNTGNGVNDTVLGHDVVSACHNRCPVHFDG